MTRSVALRQFPQGARGKQTMATRPRTRDFATSALPRISASARACWKAIGSMRSTRRQQCVSLARAGVPIDDHVVELDQRVRSDRFTPRS